MLYSEHFHDNQSHNNSINNVKKTYKVLLRIQPPYIYKVNNDYTGLMYDAWKEVKQELSNYNFEETYTEVDNNEEFIKKINEENFDLGIGAIASELSRVKEISISQSILINKCVIMFKDKHIYLRVIAKFFFLYFIPFFIAILIIAFILGYILTRNRSSGEKMDFNRTIALTASALFGSKGSLFQNVALNTKTIFIIIIILMISTFSLQLLQGIITNIIIEAGAESEVTRDTIITANLIGVKGSNVPHLIETNYHCKMEYFDGDLEETIQNYLKNTTTLDGVVANSAEALYYASKYGLLITKQFFSLNEHGWAVNFKTPELLRPLNETIRKIMDKGKMDKLCKSYLGSSESYICLF
jgi:ABC-type amino acid transport substrate-binding protein